MDKTTLDVVYFDGDLKQNLSDRLKRIEGQVRGIDKMLREDQPCPQVLNQLAACTAALRSVGTLVLRNYMENCVSAAFVSGDPNRKEAVLEELMEVLKRFGR